VKRIASQISTNISREDFNGILYYIKLNSEKVKDLCVFISGDKISVMGGGAYDVYNAVVKMVLDNNPALDLFWMRGNQSLMWTIPNHMTDKLLQEIKNELKLKGE